MLFLILLLKSNLGVTVLEYYAFLKLDAYYEVSMFFSIFCYKINSEASFSALSV